MTLVWPTELLSAQANRPPFLAVRTMAGATSINGRTQIAATDAGIWVYELGGIAVTDRDTLLTWRAIAVLLEGRLRAIDVPVEGYEGLAAPYEDGLNWPALLAPVPHDDDSFHDDGAGYAGWIADVTLAADAALRATSITVTVGYAPTLQPGQLFSVDHAVKGPRWYQVRTWDADTNTLTFRPPLREAATSGDRLEFDRPTCRMRLASDDAMAMALRPPVVSLPTVRFVEDL